MSNTINKRVLAAALVLTSQLAVSSEQAIVCPKELPANALRIVTTPQGWRPFISSPMYLHSAAPIFGPPERLGRIIGRTTKRTTGESTVEYDDLAPGPPEGIWFSCDYGDGNEFSIAKKLPAGVKSCIVKYKKGEKAGQNDLDIKCQ